jgi:hypothetical protein
MPRPPRATTKHDVALAEVHGKWTRNVALARGFIVVLGIAASALPLWALQGIVEPLAGHTTKVDVNIVVSIALSLSVVINGLQYVKGRSRRSELQRQRERLAAFEGEVAE